MRIPSRRTRQDMEIAAELRAAGATWDTIAAKLKRQTSLVCRWQKLYAEEWDRLMRDAEARLARHASNESRTVMRQLLNSDSPRVRLGAAEQLAKRRLQEIADAPSPKTNLLALLEEAEAMPDEEFEEYLYDFLEHWYQTSPELRAAGFVLPPRVPAAAPRPAEPPPPPSIEQIG